MAARGSVVPQRGFPGIPSVYSMALSWQVAQFCCLIFAVFSVSCGQEKKVVSFESIERVRYGGFSEFVKKPTVTAVYFMLKGKTNFIMVNRFSELDGFVFQATA